jgi:hypothetical protein
MLLPKRAKPLLKISVPMLEREIGAGDVVKRMTTRVGLRPCAPCENRAQRLNNYLVFRPHGHATSI